jgi:hypothetical protein
MRFISLFDGVFWGLFFVIIGVWFMVRRYVPVNIPIFRVIFAVFFVWLGIRILISSPWDQNTRPSVFSERVLEYSGAGSNGDQTVLFNSANFDLTQIKPEGSDVHKTVSVVFGSGTLRLNPAVPTLVRLSTAFGSISTPDGKSTVFGDSEYRTPAYKDGAPALVIKASAVFGSLRITE